LIRNIILTSIKLINALSLRVSKLFKSGYQIVIPYATYAPWALDQKFLEVFNKVKKNSLVNIYQCWELWKLTDETEKIFGDIIEIGVYRGATSAIMGTRLKLNDSKSTLFCCDTFEGVVKASKDDNFYKGGEHKDTSVEFIENLLGTELKLSGFKLLKGVFPDETGEQVENNKFRLCHIDVDTYQSGKEILDWIWEKMSQGGTIIFNDYGYPRTQGITKLVNEYSKGKDCITLHNLNGNAIMIKF